MFRSGEVWFGRLGLVCSGKVRYVGAVYGAVGQAGWGMVDHGAVWWGRVWNGVAGKAMKNRNHLKRVAKLPCVVCNSPEVQVHHVRNHAVSSAGKRASDWFSFPLCAIHHANLHDDIKFWEMRNGDQFRHVADTLQRLYG